MIRLLGTQPGLQNRFIAHLLTRNTRLEANLTDQLLYSSEQRLAHTLLVLADCDERRPRRCRLPALPQEIIAEMVGTTRSRVNCFMGQFKKLGFIAEQRSPPRQPARLHVQALPTPSHVLVLIIVLNVLLGGNMAVAG